MIYMIHCIISPEKKHLRGSLIEAHLANVVKHRDAIVYAGVVESESDPFQRIVYFFRANSEAEARAFVDGDAYTTIYERVEILEFQQKLPGDSIPRADSLKQSRKEQPSD